MIKNHYTGNSEDIYEYKEKRRQEKNIHRQKKKTFLEEQLKDIENLNFQKKSSKFCKLVNNIRKDFKPRITACRKSNGEITNDKGEILERIIGWSRGREIDTGRDRRTKHTQV
jgi:hypothetical protein